MAEPYPKSRQLARGERRYRRKVASPKQWAAIIAEKGTACRMVNEYCDGPIQYHHVVWRGAPYLGDDVADNIIPLCRWHHHGVQTDQPGARRALPEQLTDAEYAYVIGKLGEDGPRRLFGV